MAWEHRAVVGHINVMRGRALGVLLITSLAVWACSLSKPAPTPSAGVRPTRPTDAHSADAGARSTLDPRLEAKLAEIHRLHDWRSTVFGTGLPNSSIPARRRSVPKHGPFRLKAVATIRAYHYRLGYTNAGARERYDSFDPPFTPDGRLDGHVVPPEAVLTDEERESVLRVIRDAQDQELAYARGGGKRPVLHCMYSPHHVFVLFDAADTPIAKLFVDYACHEMHAVPSTPTLGGDDTTILTQEQAQQLADISDRHGLGAWTYGNRPELDELLAYGKTTREYRTRDEERPSGVPTDATPENATPLARQRFCVWLRAEMWERRREGGWPNTGSFDCKNGTTYRFSEETPVTNDCETARLCNVRFEKIEACLRASFLNGPDELCSRGASPACDGLLKCLPYVLWEAR